MKDFYNVELTLASALAASGTVAVSYPAGTDAGTFRSGVNHKATLIGNVLTAPKDFTLTFGAASITFTYGAGKTTAPAGSRLRVQLEVGGGSDFESFELPNKVTRANAAGVYVVNLGAPDVLDADGVAVAQAVAGAGNLTLNGALVAGGVATFDVPRGVQIVSSGAGDTTQTATFTGTDEYGVAVKETLTFNGVTPVLGKKAFKTVTQVAISAALAGNASAGSTDILGLPVFLANVAFVLKELQDGAAATAGTLVAGVNSVATATTGDVRGTYDPNAATDGAKAFELVAVLTDPQFLGRDQFAA